MSLIPALNKLEKRLQLAEEELTFSGDVQPKGWADLVSDASDKLLEEFNGIYAGEKPVEKIVESKKVVFETLMGLVSHIRVDFREIVHGVTLADSRQRDQNDTAIAR